VFLLLASARAGADRPETWTADNLVRQQHILEVVISPADLRVVVWVQRKADEKKDRFLTPLVRQMPLAPGTRSGPARGRRSPGSAFASGAAAWCSVAP